MATEWEDAVWMALCLSLSSHLDAEDAPVADDSEKPDYTQISQRTDEMLGRCVKEVAKSMAHVAEKRLRQELRAKPEEWWMEMTGIFRENRSPPVALDIKTKKVAADQKEVCMEDSTERSKEAPKKRKAADRSEDETDKPTPKKPKATRKGEQKKHSSTKKKCPRAKKLNASKVAEQSSDVKENTTLPEAYKNLWGQVGFAKWNRTSFPCLIIGPDDVGPWTSVHKQWMKTLDKNKDRSHQMSHLIYWYGSSDDLDSAFGFVDRSSLKLYDDPTEKNLRSLPHRIQKKIDSGKTLDEKEKELVQSYKEMANDLAKSPEERRKRVQRFYNIDNGATTLHDTGKGYAPAEEEDLTEKDNKGERRWCNDLEDWETAVWRR